ncbi:MAG: diguanylate cyclase [Acidobacteriia bacterium]|nr:diguanylate cyclase [Terriglobia bacterium]
MTRKPPHAALNDATRVLLVDDQALVGEAVRRLLSDQLDIMFCYCPDPEKAIYQANKLNPTVILQDLLMPGIDGLTLVRRFRSNPATSEVPIIVLSTKDDPQVKSQSFLAGANDYLVKLPDKIELIARIRYHSRAFLNQVQRAAAYQALQESERKLSESNASLLLLNQRLEEVNGRIFEMARRDPLTGLVNRRVLDDELTKNAERSIREGHPLTALILDLDYFKSVNDSFGHRVGDAILIAVAEFLARNVRPYDVVARFGGDEFVILLPSCGLETGVQTGERICAQLRALKVVDCPRTITASIGVAALLPGQSTQRLLERADTALYNAKKNGRNQVISEFSLQTAASPSDPSRPDDDQDPPTHT